MNKRKAELLAPAGSFDSLRAAVAAGADAVYMGGQRFGARAYADNPDEKGLLEAIDYVHLHGRRLYMTVNTLFKEEELDSLYQYMLPYYRQGLDGVIVQDLGALRLLRESFPDMELHASTQMTITSAYGARLLMDMGCSRIVTARELSFNEIGRIYQETGAQIESFIHGALCYCYSGQCLMSSLIGGRSGNRGRCAQPCRLPYTVYKDQGSPLNPKSESYVLSPKDLCTLDILPDILEAGVYSLKIEGRMKSPRYTAGVTRIYRKYLDHYLEQGRKGYHVAQEDRKELSELFDRGGFTSGYYERQNGRSMITLKEKPEFREGNQKLFQYLDKTYVETEIKEPVLCHGIFQADIPSRLCLRSGEAEVVVEGQAPEKAQNQPLTEEKLCRQLEKLGNTPFYLEKLSVELEGNLFLPVQAVNELRRKGLSALEQEIKAGFRRTGQAKREAGKDRKMAANTAVPKDFFLSASLEGEEQLSPVLECDFIGRIYLDAGSFRPGQWKEIAKRCRQEKKQCYLMLPQIFRAQAEQFLEHHKEELEEAGFDGLLLKALEEAKWVKERGIRLPWGFDASVYAWNRNAVQVLKETGACFLTLPWELNSKEMEPVLEACHAEKVRGELIVYGHAPMMVSAQCLVRTVKGCTHKQELLYIKDRKGAKLPVKNCCVFCCNTIYNSLPQCLADSETVIQKMGIRQGRLSFTIEDREQTREALKVIVNSLCLGKTIEKPLKEFTRGHFRRKVE